MGAEVEAQHILNLGTKCRSILSFTLRPLYYKAKRSEYQYDIKRPIHSQLNWAILLC